MGNAEVDITIDRPADDVWKIAGDFGGLATWVPGMESCRLEGDDRIISMGGMEITEHLVRRDDAERVLVYSITNGVPVERHQTTVAVKPRGDGSHVTMTVDVEPDALAEVMAGTYSGFLGALKAKAEGS